ncbi:MAG: FMN-binding glutamate synthase family protein [Myxococcales bacterium]|nr:FMN-binding glutamate synthase family protein [Myxococcales bacterium]
MTAALFSARGLFVAFACLSSAVLAGLAWWWPPAALGFTVVGPLVALGCVDMTQKKMAIRRNFPVIGHARYLLEKIRPEIQQYFIESNSDGRPFTREERSLVYQRAKGQLDTIPFGTQRDVYAVGYEWINHSLAPVPVEAPPPRVQIGEGTCQRPYAASLLNVSAMSFGALSANAIMALNRAAREGKFAHNTGEGGISAHHRQGGALIWQVGTGYFGCRDRQGRFSAERFRERAADDAVRMIEVKLSQGAKPGHGGILPAAKLSPEIAEIRGVPLGEDVASPPAHSAFSTPIELLEFLTSLRELSGGKPVGMKLCVGKRREFLAICKAMLETRMHPDYIVVDGGEGGTGAAPVEFSNVLGCPLTEGLVFVHNALGAAGMRDRVKLIASGKIATGFGVVKLISLGADLCYSARAMMMALGCIQARRCNSNDCPVGVATQDPSLTVGLDVEEKAARVLRYQQETVEAALELIGAAGLPGPEALRPWHVMRRVSPTEVHHYGELFESFEPGCLARGVVPKSLERAWNRSVSYSFDSVEKAA